VIYSHSCMRAIWDHPRNISHDQARACAATGGVIGITGVGIFLGPNSPMLDTSRESSHSVLPSHLVLCQEMLDNPVPVDA
jgi:microsomal dipeptidase-like Zn-dependent dipeptidase